MYENNKTKSYGGLGHQWGSTEMPSNPKDYIPKKTKPINAMQAALLIAKSRGAKVKWPQDHIFWADRGPLFSLRKKVPGGIKEGEVPLPPKAPKSQEEVLRGEPYSEAPPVQVPYQAQRLLKSTLGGLKEACNKNPRLIVLGLLLLILFLYLR